MNHIQRILVPTDYSQTSANALSVALGFAAKLGAGIEILHAWNPYPYVDAVMGEEAYSRVASEVRKDMMDFVASLPVPANVNITSRVQQGVAWEVITSLSSEYDMIIMGTAGHTGMKRIMLGSVANRVIQHADCPVMTVRDDGKKRVEAVTPAEETVVHAVFREDADLPKVFQGIKAAGISVDDVSLVMTEDTHNKDFAALEKTKALKGATAGGFVGSIVGGAVGMGLILTGGMGLVVFGPALAFAATGGLFGGLLGRSVPDDKANLLKAQLSDGKTLLAIHVKDPSKVVAVHDVINACDGEVFDM